MRPGNVHSADGWRKFLKPIVDRYKEMEKKECEQMKRFMSLSVALIFVSTQHILACVAQFLNAYFWRLVGRDNITFTKIIRRNDLREIGTQYGGFVVPTDLLSSNSICYCAGCGEDISFDLGLISQFGCVIFGFDPTPRSIDYVKETAGQNQKYHFFKVGLWDREDTLKFYVPRDPKHVSHSLLNLQKTKEYIEVEVKRLRQIMVDNGHTKIDLLKLDIEGAEYKVIDTIVEDNLNIKIICVEYDECNNALDSSYKRRIRTSVSKLLATGYSMVYAQGGEYTFIKNG